MGTKISALTASSGLAAADLIPVVDDPGGTPVTQKATITQVEQFLINSRNCCTLEQFGAVGDGVTSDQTAFEAARAALAAGTYGCLLLGAKTYLVTGTADEASNPWPFGVAIIGQGPQSVLKTTTNNEVLIFRSTVAEDRVKGTLLSNFRILGNDAGVNQWGIAAGFSGGDGPGSGFQVTNVDVIDCAIGFFWGYGPAAGDGPKFTACTARDCLYGFEGIWQANLNGCQATDCGTGILVATGNINWTGGDITGCDTAPIQIDAGGNDGHGVFCGAQINHNAGVINIGAIANGHTFEGCHIYDTGITVGANTGLTQFTGCIIDATTFSFTSSLVKFSNCRLDQAYFSAYNESGTPDVEWLNCREMDGTVPSFVADRVQLAYTYGSDANATLTKQQSRAEVIVVAAGVISTGRDLVSAHAPAGAKSRQITIRNNNANSVTYKWSTGTGVEVVSGHSVVIGSDGTNAIALTYAPTE